MKCTSILTLALTLSAASMQAQQSPQQPADSNCSKGCQVQMSFSGTLTVLPPINFFMAPPTATPFELTGAGNGSLGRFTVHDVRATLPFPKPLPNPPCVPFVILAGVFRFDDGGPGSLLMTKLINGSECVNTTDFTAIVTLSLQITGGTGRFAGASGMLNFTSAPAEALLFDNTGPPSAVLIAVTEVTVKGTLILPDQKQGQQ